jgi:hypothetical protein
VVRKAGEPYLSRNSRQLSTRSRGRHRLGRVSFGAPRTLRYVSAGRLAFLSWAQSSGGRRILP